MVQFAVYIISVVALLQLGCLGQVDSSLTTGNTKNCTDCCDLQNCLGLTDKYFEGLNSTDQYLTDMCSEKNIAILPTCYTKHNFDHCSYMKKLASKLPSQDNVAKGIIQYCENINVTKALSKCVAASGEADELYERCLKPYMDGMKDNDSGVCQVMDNYVKCSLAIIKTANCSETLGENLKRVMQQQKLDNPLCESNVASTLNNCVNLMTISLVFFWFISYSSYFK